jgi:hypothetical protein
LFRRGGAEREDLHEATLVTADIVASAEDYQNHSSGTNASFVDALNHAALERPVDPIAGAFFCQALAGDENHGQVAAALFGCTEYRHDLVPSDSQSYLHRPADTSGFISSVQALASGATVAAVLTALVGSEECFTKP